MSASQRQSRNAKYRAWLGTGFVLCILVGTSLTVLGVTLLAFPATLLAFPAAEAGISDRLAGYPLALLIVACIFIVVGVILKLWANELAPNKSGSNSRKKR